MTRIAVIDLASGETSERSGDTLTLDVPTGLPSAGAVSVVDGVRGHYLAADGHGLVYGVVLRPLCWRARGETCLVARTGGSKRRTRQFRMSRIEPPAS
ncbi:MAG: hypothetical protein ACJ79H_05395 [Myxococcales bacterium]